MKKLTATEFKARCLEILDRVPPEGIAITKRGKTVARVYPEEADALRFLGRIPDLVRHPDVLSTGERWEAEEA
jgi:prevent-host-death family protein